MAILKSINSKAPIKNGIDYISREDKTNENLLSSQNCSVENAVLEMETIKKLYGQQGGRTYKHYVISFNPADNVSEELAYTFGKEYMKNAEKWKDHQTVMAVHTDTDNIHVHFIINSVNFENGKKYHETNQDLEKMKEKLIEQSKEYDLTIPEKKAKARYSHAEYGLAKRGIVSWKDEIRLAVDEEINQSKDFTDLQKRLKANHDIKLVERGKNITFTHPNGQKSRGNKLGENYDKGEIKNVLSKPIQEREPRSREERAEQETRTDTTSRDERINGRNEESERSDEELYNGAHGQGHNESADSDKRDSSDREHECTSARTDEFDIGKAQEHVRNLSRENAKNVSRATEPDARTRAEEHRKAREIEQQDHEQHAERDRVIKSRGFEPEL